jgi:hypothetical protein
MTNIAGTGTQIVTGAAFLPVDIALLGRAGTNFKQGLFYSGDDR